MRTKFIFSKDTRLLKRHYELWKKGKAFGRYILIGPSGSGKSLFLNQLIEKLETERCKYTGQEIEDLLLENVRENRMNQLPTAPVMIFEDVDCLINSTSIKKQFDTLIRQYQFDENGQKRLILMTAVDFMAFQLAGDAIPVNPLCVSWKVIRIKAKEQQMKLSIVDYWRLSSCRRVSEVEAELRKLKMKKEM